MTAPVAFVDLSGYAFTGKHAVIDLMREIDGYHVPHFQFEFALLRIQGGILDLEHALCDDWSPIRSDAAIRRFKRLVRRLGASNRLASPRSWFEAVGWNYDDYYGGRFFELSQRYLERLIAAEWSAPWPYALAECSNGELFVRKLKQKARWPHAMDFVYHLSRPGDFIPTTREYLEAILTSNTAPGTRVVVMHNAFEPYQPARSLKFFERAKSIVVDRDPRDTYVQGLWYAPVATGVREFIARYRIQRQATDYAPHRGVLRIRFEDLVLDYGGVVDRIFEHLDESPSRHARRRQCFDPDQSRRNIGIWQAYSKQDEIGQIEAALPEFCDAKSGGGRVKLTFFFPYYEVSGVPVLFSRLAPHLAAHHGADVEVVDYPDGYMSRTLRASPGVRVVPFARGKRLEVGDDRLLVMQSILPATIHAELGPAPQTRLLFWTLHPMNLVQTLIPSGWGRNFQARHAWVGRAAGRTVLRRFSKDLSAFVMRLVERDSLVFVDGSTHEATCESLGITIPTPTFVPTPCLVDDRNPSRDNAVHDPIGAAWVGRLDDFKVPMIVHTLGALSAYAKEQGRSIRFTIVGDGPLRAAIRENRFVHDRSSVVYAGALDGEALDRFLGSQVDVLFAMGTSALEGAKLGVPTVLLDVAYGRVPAGYVFRWLHESTNFGLGSMVRLRPLVSGNDSLARIMASTIERRAIVSAAAHRYCLENHALEPVARRFMGAAARASFRFVDMSPRLRRKSVVRRVYEWTRLRRTGERYPSGRFVRRADSR